LKPANGTDNLAVRLSEYPGQKEISVITVKGYIDSTTAPEFEKTFLSVLRDKKFKMVVDLKETDYISSAGWGLFVSEIKRIRGEKGDLVLSGMSPDVFEIFKLLEFDTFLRFFPDVESAVEKGFGTGPAIPASVKPPNHSLKENK
jgi:stage II sporulation protein AA (anti-sigma F factor antagonist)